MLLFFIAAPEPIKPVHLYFADQVVNVAIYLELLGFGIEPLEQGQVSLRIFGKTVIIDEQRIPPQILLTGIPDSVLGEFPMQ